MNLIREIYDQLETALQRFPGRKRSAKETHEFIKDWWEQEEARRYNIGCPDFTDRPALLYAVCGLRELCGVNRRTALHFLRMAVTELETNHPHPKDLAEVIYDDVNEAREIWERLPECCREKVSVEDVLAAYADDQEEPA